jgi:hypothetical protein
VKALSSNPSTMKNKLILFLKQKINQKIIRMEKNQEYKNCYLLMGKSKPKESVRVEIGHL